jgi:hypothetical protein
MLGGLRTCLPRPLASTGLTAAHMTDHVRARYCYSVWLRHLSLAQRSGVTTAPVDIAELGPGASIGVGLMALLTGSERYYALDAVARLPHQRRQAVQRDLVALLAARDDVPGEDEFPRLKPLLPDYAFPTAILSTSACAVSAGGARAHRCLDLVYQAMATWLRRGGVMSHQIDFKCHTTASTWNGHWAYGDLTWKLIKGRRPYVINRQPLSTHLHLLSRRHLTDDDLTTSAAYILAVKPGYQGVG